MSGTRFVLLEQSRSSGCSPAATPRETRPVPVPENCVQHLHEKIQQGHTSSAKLFQDPPPPSQIFFIAATTRARWMQKPIRKTGGFRRNPVMGTVPDPAGKKSGRGISHQQKFSVTLSPRIKKIWTSPGDIVKFFLGTIHYQWASPAAKLFFRIFFRAENFPENFQKKIPEIIFPIFSQNFSWPGLKNPAPATQPLRRKLPRKQPPGTTCCETLKPPNPGLIRPLFPNGARIEPR